MRLEQLPILAWDIGNVPSQHKRRCSIEHLSFIIISLPAALLSFLLQLHSLAIVFVPDLNNNRTNQIPASARLFRYLIFTSQLR
jgi:hypothetical protein